MVQSPLCSSPLEFQRDIGPAGLANQVNMKHWAQISQQSFFWKSGIGVRLMPALRQQGRDAAPITRSEEYAREEQSDNYAQLQLQLSFS